MILFKHVFVKTCSIFDQERLDRLTKGIGDLDCELSESDSDEASPVDVSHSYDAFGSITNPLVSHLEGSELVKVADEKNNLAQQTHDRHFDLNEYVSNDTLAFDQEADVTKREPRSGNLEDCDDDFTPHKQVAEKRLPSAVLPLLRYYQYESSESSGRY